MYRKIRIVVEICLFFLISFFLIDFADIFPSSFHWLTKIQLMPALIRGSIVIVSIILLFTLLMGRIYCSSVCPLGVLQDIIAYFSKAGKQGKKKKYSYSKPHNILRISVFIVSIILLYESIALLMSLIEPYSVFGRIMVDLFKPIYLLGNNLLATIFMKFDNFTFYQMNVAIQSMASFCITAILLIIIAVLSWRNGRTWCNSICPVGTLLGVISRYSFFKIRINKEKCIACGRCATNCKSSCIDAAHKKIDYTRCVNCFDCLDSCSSRQALSYRFSFPWKKEAGSIIDKKEKTTEPEEVPDQSMRTFLLAGLTSAIAAPKVFAQAKSLLAKGEHCIPYVRKQPITPPGSISLNHFQTHCTACHLCVSKCPSHVLKPAFDEYGFSGVMQPTMNFEKGFCNFDCNICGHVCPNGAIKPLTIQKKHHVQTGTVTFIKENCIVYREGTNCGACSEHCPTQAISMVPYKNGLTIPETNPDICVGCGGCEYVCPARPYRAVHVEGNIVQQQAKSFEEKKIQIKKIDNFGF
jgi:ferredoxin